MGKDTISVYIKKEANIEKGSGQQLLTKVSNLSIEQVISIAKETRHNMYAKDLKAAVKTVIGSCQALGILVEGLDGKEACRDVDAGRFDKEVHNQKTETSPDKLKLMKDQLNQIQVRLEKEKASQEKLEETPKEEKKEEVKVEAKEKEEVKVEKKKK